MSCEDHDHPKLRPTQQSTAPKDVCEQEPDTVKEALHERVRSKFQGRNFVPLSELISREEWNDIVKKAATEHLNYQPNKPKRI